jgi:hypothetical protein
MYVGNRGSVFILTENYLYKIHLETVKGRRRITGTDRFPFVGEREMITGIRTELHGRDIGTIFVDRERVHEVYRNGPS